MNFYYIKTIFGRKQDDRSKEYTLMEFGERKIDTFYVCRKFKIPYYRRSETFYKLRSFRKNRIKSKDDENQDLLREYLLKTMIRFLDKENTAEKI